MKGLLYVRLRDYTCLLIDVLVVGLVSFLMVKRVCFEPMSPLSAGGDLQIATPLVSKICPHRLRE